jgi:hypothetical protein
MTVTIIRGTEITRPTPDPLKSSVLDHVQAAGNLVQNAHFGMRNNEGLWPSYNCIDTLTPTPICPDPLGEGKSFQTVGWVPGLEFAIHGGVQCSTVGLDRADQKRELERVFALNEGKGIEQVLLFNRFVATDSGVTPAWDGAVDLTPASAVDVKTALAILEGHAASVYAGVPTIHMPRAAASLLNERIIWKGDLAYTRMGSKVAMGGGYDTPEVPSGSWDLFVTGEVYVERSEEVSIQTFVVPGDGSGTGSDENGLTDNTVVGLVERMFRVGIDCFVAKVTATVPAVTGGGFGV